MEEVMTGFSGRVAADLMAGTGRRGEDCDS